MPDVQPRTKSDIIDYRIKQVEQATTLDPLSLDEILASQNPDYFTYSEETKLEEKATHILSQDEDYSDGSIESEDEIRWNLDNIAKEYTNNPEATKESVFQYWHDKWINGRINVTLSDIAYKDLEKGIDPETDPNIKYWQRQILSPDRIKRALPARAIGEMVEQLPMYLEATKRALPVGLGTGLTWTLASLAFTGWNPLAPVSAISGAAGFAVGEQVAAVTEIGKWEAGNAYLELSQIKGPNGEKLDINLIRPLAVTAGVINAILETTQIETLLASFGLKKLSKRGAKLLLVNLSKDPRITKLLWKSAKEYGKNLTAETIQEIMQEATNIFMDEIGIYIHNAAPNEKIKHNWDKALPRLLEIAKKAALGFSVMLLPGHTFSFSKEVFGSKINKVVEETIEEEKALEKVKEDYQDVEIIDNRTKTIEKKQIKTKVMEDENKVTINEAELSEGDTVKIDNEEWEVVAQTSKNTILENKKTKDKMTIPSFGELKIDIPEEISLKTEEGEHIIITPKDIREEAKILRNKALEEYKVQEETSILAQLREKGLLPLNPGIWKNTEEIQAIPKWLRGKVFSDNAIDTLDTAARQIGYRSDMDLLNAIVNYAHNRENKPSTSIKDYMDEARMELERYAGMEGKDLVIKKEEIDEAAKTPYQKLRDEAIKDIKFLRSAKRYLYKAYSLGKKVKSQEIKEKLKKIRKKQLVLREINRRRKKAIEQIKRISQRVNKLPSPQREDIQKILSDIDFRKLTSKKKMRLENIRDYLENNPNTELPDKIIEDLKRLDKKPVADMSLEELESLRDAVAHLYKLGKLKTEIKVGRERKAFKQTLEQIFSEMKPPEKVNELFIGIPKERFGGVKDLGYKLRLFFGQKSQHYDLLIEAIAGETSTIYQVLYRDLHEGKRVEYRTKTHLWKLFQKSLKEAGFNIKSKKIDNWLNEETTVVVNKETGKTISLPRNYKLALYRHYLNKDNRTAIIEGGFELRTFKSRKKPIRYHLTAEEYKVLVDSMTKDELAFANHPVTILLDETYNLQDKIFYQKNGYHLPKVEGLYYHKEVLGEELNIEEEQKEIVEAIKQGRFLRVGLPKGHLKSRIGSKAGLMINPLTYDLNRQINWASAYYGLELPLREASKVLYNKEFRKELKKRYGDELYKDIEKGVKDIVGEWKEYDIVETTFLKLKSRAAIAALTNPRVWIMQTLSYILGIVYIKPKYLMSGLWENAVHSKRLHQQHTLFSPQYELRSKGFISRDIADIAKKASTRQIYGGRKTFKEIMFSPMRFFDVNTVSALMEAAKEQVLDEIKEGKLSRKVEVALNIKSEDLKGLGVREKLELAYRFADYVVERTQPMFSPEHRSTLSRGGALSQLLTMYSAFTNQAYNLIYRTILEYKRTGDREAFGRMMKAAIGVTLSAMVAPAMIRAMFDALKGKKRNFFIRLIEGAASMFYVIRDIIPIITSYAEKGPLFSFDFNLPVGQFFTFIGKMFGSVARMIYLKNNKAKRERIEREWLGVLSYGVGLPYTLARDTINIIKYRKKEKKNDKQQF